MSEARAPGFTRVDFGFSMKTQCFRAVFLARQLAQVLAGTQCGTGSEKKQNLHSGVRKNVENPPKISRKPSGNVPPALPDSFLEGQQIIKLLTSGHPWEDAGMMP